MVAGQNDSVAEEKAWHFSQAFSALFCVELQAGSSFTPGRVVSL
jgi:hypothetical protein